MKLFSGALFGMLALGALACSSLSDDIKLVDLDHAQAEELCSDLGTEQPLRCGEIESQPIPPAACGASFDLFPDSCAATVGDYRTCFEATKADPCHPPLGDECTNLNKCFVAEGD